MRCIGKVALRAVLLLAVLALAAPPRSSAQQKKPNIIVIFGDDVGYWNISAYNQGMMGYKTPNIDRIAHEAHFSLTTMLSRVAPLDAPHSSLGNLLFARV